MLSFIYCTVWKLWHWGCLFFWVSKLLINQSLVFKSIFSVSFYVHHKMKQRTFQWSECSTQLISLQSWVTGRIWSALSVLFQCGCLFCTTIQAKINGSRLKAHSHTLCTTLLFLAPNGCIPSPVLTTSLTIKAWGKQGSEYQATLFLPQFLF